MEYSRKVIPTLSTLSNPSYMTGRLFAHTVHPYSRLKTDAFGIIASGRLEYLKGVVKDFFVDWHKFRGENVKHVMGDIDDVFDEYSLEAMTMTLER